MNYKYLILVSLSIQLMACKTTRSLTNSSTSITSKKLETDLEIRFIGEQILPENTTFENTKVGGLSSIDYVEGNYYLISDDKKKTRFYEMNLEFDTKGFYNIEVTDVIYIANEDKGLDPEGLRFDYSTGNFYWTSEGFIRRDISPAIYEINKNGLSIKTVETPKMFHAGKKDKGPRVNGTFEGLSLSKDMKSLWIAMELPLKEDGNEPTLKKENYPVRISNIDKKTGEIIYQFAYNLDEIPRDSKPKGKYLVNGISEILVLDEKHFFVVERAYASGHKDGGNTIKIYLVDLHNATNTTHIESLQKTVYTAASKTLVFDFDTVRSELTNGIIDNIEGITFGPDLANGHKTLIVVSDNNFNKFSKQLNQFIVLEILSMDF